MKSIIYQMLPRLWGNGKFSSVDAGSLDYIKGLGAHYIWFTGIIRHATSATEKVVKGDAGSPYAITDYFDVNPYLADSKAGRMKEFQALLDRTHKAGLKAIIDFVPNHVAREYKGALGKDDDTSVHWKAENDFFYYPGEQLKLPVKSSYKEFPAKASGNAFTSTPDINDWWETVKLNYCPWHTATWDKMYDAVRFWALKGVDGFRCDMVELVPPEFMQWLIREIKREFPSVIFIAEVYQKEKYRMYIDEIGFDLLYDKSGLYDTLRAVTCSNASAKGITWNWQFLQDLQPRMLNFLENHDEQRLSSDFFACKPENGNAAMAVSLLLNTAPFMLYFGQEQGERGMDKEGFSGLDGRTSIFDWGAKHFCPGEILPAYRELLDIAMLPAFRDGRTFDLCYCQDGAFDPDRHFAWLRSDGKECYLIAANFGPKTDITLRIPPEALQYLGIKAVRTVYSVTIPGKDYAIITVE